jgi:predicted RNase H-like nuclease (RuvC/YqgF family)
MTSQLEEFDSKNSAIEKASKNLREQVEELTEQLSEETRAKLAASNKQKHLQDEVERLNAQLEDEEEAKEALQTKLVGVNAQVSARGCGREGRVVSYGNQTYVHPPVGRKLGLQRSTIFVR